MFVPMCVCTSFSLLFSSALFAIAIVLLVYISLLLCQSSVDVDGMYMYITVNHYQLSAIVTVFEYCVLIDND